MNSAHHPPPHEWRSFFAEFRQYGSASPRQLTRAVAPHEAEAFFTLFSQRYSPFVQSGGTINVWDIAGVGTDEVRNCAILGWLLDCHGSHGQGASFLRCFLDSVRYAPQNDSSSLMRLPQAVHVSPPYRTTLENTYSPGDLCDNGPNNRVDIVIENESFLLFIEVKIHARETGNQLERYSNILQAHACNKPCGLVFLTLTGRAARDESAKGIACLNWKHLADSLEAFIHVPNDSGESVSAGQPLWASLVQQFCIHIRQF